MGTEEDKIRQMLKDKFDQKAEPMTLSDFDKIQLKVSNKKFFTFQPRVFNIYYAFAVASIWLLTLGLGVNYYISKQQLKKDLNELNIKIDDFNSKLELLQKANSQTITIVKPNTSSDSTTSRIQVGKTLVENTVKTTTQTAKVVIEKDKVTKSPTTIIKDTLHHVKVAEPDAAVKPKVPVYIIKQDTIIRFDSIKVKKKH